MPVIEFATSIPVGAATPVVSIAPITLPAAERGIDLQLRISAPTHGDALPIVLLSHGHGMSNHLSSLNGYGPVASFWAAHGFVVIQPTHLDSKTIQLENHPEAPLFWQARARDMQRILDRLDELEAAAPYVRGRLDRSRVAVVGHSMGGHTAEILMGASVVDPNTGTRVDMKEPRIKAGVILAGPGRGDALSDYAAKHYGFFSTLSFAAMDTPALVVAGSDDPSPHLTTAGADWHKDPYTLAPGSKTLLWLAGAGHLLGGISGYDAAETTDESPERVATVARLVWAYLRSQLYPGDPAWTRATAALPAAVGTIEAK